MKKLNKSLETAVKDLNDYILSLDVVKEFKYYENIIQNHPELKVMEDTLKQMQKDIVNHKHSGEDCDNLIQDYHKLKDQFENHPYVYNYLNLKQEVNDLIQMIQNDINTQLKIKAESNVK